jgi:oxygen-independent coproporphyrinogen-3 oxidase
MDIDLNQPNAKKGGLYIHIPFCVQKCPYCDFYSITDLSRTRPFLSALLKEMEMVQPTETQFDTIYIGGGTPSILAEEEIAKLLETTQHLFRANSNSEITIEVNPGTVDLEKLSCYKTAGINRINIGVQSFNNSHLAFLGRIHNKEKASTAIEQSQRAGFDNIGLDLIYGLPDQTEDDWIMDLQTAIGFKPEHLSCYMLTYEKGTDMWNKMKRKDFYPLPDERVARLFEHTIAFLEDNGYTQYEISNFSKSVSEDHLNYASKHNQKYWTFASYIGFGPSAHSHTEPKRSWNVRSIEKYIDLLNEGKKPIDGEETLTREQMMTESIYLGLRKTNGIDVGTFNNKFSISFNSLFEEVIADLTDKELISVDKEKCKLTRKGMLFLDSIASLFIDNVQ